MRSTPTNSGPDSSGAVRFGRWEFEGNGYLFVVGGALLGVLTFILCPSAGYTPRLALASLPLAAALGWVKFFIVGRPPHFCGDFFEGLLVGSHFNLQPQAWTKVAHPHGERVRHHFQAAVPPRNPGRLAGAPRYAETPAPECVGCPAGQEDPLR